MVNVGGGYAPVDDTRLLYWALQGVGGAALWLTPLDDAHNPHRSTCDARFVDVSATRNPAIWGCGVAGAGVPTAAAVVHGACAFVTKLRACQSKGVCTWVDPALHNYCRVVRRPLASSNSGYTMIRVMALYFGGL